MTLQITPENIENNAWVFSFLEQQRQDGKYYWGVGKNYTYNDKLFEFKEPVLARLRKNGRGCAYEMICKTKRLGSGYYGEVYEISCTLSNGKEGKFQARNKERVVKIQSPSEATYEYKHAKLTNHLHVKKPTNGYTVMKKMPGQTMYNFFRLSSRLSPHNTLALTKTLLIAFNEQLYKKNLCHNDLHLGNILIKSCTNEEKKCFEVNIIDYGAAYSKKNNLLINNSDFANIKEIILVLWGENHHNYPVAINNLLKSTRNLDHHIQELEKQLISPTETSQKPLDNICAYLEVLSKENSELTDNLKNTIIDALEKSSQSDFQPLKEAVYLCYTRLKEENIDYFPVFKSIFHSNPKKQVLFNKIMHRIELIEQKGKVLVNNSRVDEGNKLIKLSKVLYEKTFLAANKSTESCQKVLSDCGEYCKNMLTKHKELLDIHRNYNYIWAEITVVLISLVVFYPIVAGIHYLATKQVGFFNQTHTAWHAEKLNTDFTALMQVKA